MKRRPAPRDRLQREYDALVGRVRRRLEYWTSLTVALGAFLVAAIMALADYRRGSMPVRVIELILVVGVWYLGVHAAVRSGRYPRWLRFVNAVFDVFVGTAVMYFDCRFKGAAFALAGGGPNVYFVAVAATTLRLDPRLSLFIGLFAAVQYAVVSFGFLVPAVPPAVAAIVGVDPSIHWLRAVMLVVIGVFGYIATRSLREVLLRTTTHALERARVRDLFGVHVSEEVVEALLKGGLPESGERRLVTIAFTDIRDFTKLSESRPPEEVLRLLNRYFERMCAIAAAHGGVVNKFLGDGMLLVFGAPRAMADDAAAALASAEEMVREAERMSLAGEFPGLRIGIGLHRGEAVVGNVGGPQRQEYTVIGDTVNSASRVQDLTKSLGRSIVLTRAVADALPDRALEPLGDHLVKGRAEPLTLYGPAPVARMEAGAA